MHTYLFTLFIQTIKQINTTGRKRKTRAVIAGSTSVLIKWLISVIDTLTVYINVNSHHANSSLVRYISLVFFFTHYYREKLSIPCSFCFWQAKQQSATLSMLTTATIRDVWQQQCINEKPSLSYRICVIILSETGMGLSIYLLVFSTLRNYSNRPRRKCPTSFIPFAYEMAQHCTQTGHHIKEGRKNVSSYIHSNI